MSRSTSKIFGRSKDETPSIQLASLDIWILNANHYLISTTGPKSFGSFFDDITSKDVDVASLKIRATIEVPEFFTDANVMGEQDGELTKLKKIISNIKSVKIIRLNGDVDIKYIEVLRNLAGKGTTQLYIKNHNSPDMDDHPFSSKLFPNLQSLYILNSKLIGVDFSFCAHLGIVEYSTGASWAVYDPIQNLRSMFKNRCNVALQLRIISRETVLLEVVERFGEITKIFPKLHGLAASVTFADVADVNKREQIANAAKKLTSLPIDRFELWFVDMQRFGTMYSSLCNGWDASDRKSTMFLEEMRSAVLTCSRPKKGFRLNLIL